MLRSALSAVARFPCRVTHCGMWYLPLTQYTSGCCHFVLYQKWNYGRAGQLKTKPFLRNGILFLTKPQASYIRDFNLHIKDCENLNLFLFYGIFFVTFFNYRSFSCGCITYTILSSAGLLK